MKEPLSMNQKEQLRLKILVQIQKRQMKYHEADVGLALSRCRVCRLMRQYHEEGDPGLAHRHGGNLSNRAIRRRSAPGC